MNKQLLLSEFLTTPWALMPERLQAMSGILTRWSAGEPPSDETMFQVNTDRVLRDSRKQMAAASTGSGIAVLPPVWGGDPTRQHGGRHLRPRKLQYSAIHIRFAANAGR